MKRKNLERAVVLGLLVSSVYSTAWAANPAISIDADGNVEYVNNEPVTTTGNWNLGSVDESDLSAFEQNGEYHLNDYTVVANGIYDINGSYSPFSLDGLNYGTDQGKILNIDGDLYIDITADLAEEANGRLTLNGIYANGNTIKANGDVYLKAIAPYVSNSITSNAIEANVPSAGFGSNDYDSKIIINESNDKDKKIQIFGNVKVENEYSGDSDNSITVNMANSSSYWYGVVNSGYNDVTISLSNGAKWVPVDYNSSRSATSTKTEYIGTINLNDGGIVDISKYNMDDAPEDAIVAGVAMGEERTAETNHEVNITTLNGSDGLFKMDLNYLDENGEVYTGNKGYNDMSDYLDIGTGTEGTQYIAFNAKDANIDKMSVGDKIYFANVETDEGLVFDSTENLYSASANVFNYHYGVGSEAGTSDSTDWYIGLTGKTPDGNPNYDSNKAAMYAGYALGTEMDRLNKHMGEARYLEDEKGLWVRYRHAKTGWDNTFETDSDMFQLGYDKLVSEEDGRHYRGVAVDYTDADTSLYNVSGDGENERYAVSLYDTWLGEKGHYRDLVIRGGRINSEYNLRGYFTDGIADMDSDYHQWFGSISAEWGRKNEMDKGWYFEPQTQLQLARVGGASYVTSNGIAVDQDGATSLIGRVGFRLGREYAKADGTRHDNYYIKADLLHEFMGDKAISLTGADGSYSREYDGDETWFDVGVGADISMGKDSYFWLDAEHSFGSDWDNTWQVNCGVRWEWK